VRTLLRENSLLTGKNTGNFTNSAGSFWLLAVVNASFSIVSGPKRQLRPQIEQGIIRGIAGNLESLIRELSPLLWSM